MHPSVSKTVISPKEWVVGLLLAVVLFDTSAWAQSPLPVNPFGPAKNASPSNDGDEPAALNPFGQVKRDRDDAVPGYVEMSDGRILAGDIYMTRDKRLKFYDPKLERQREIPLQRVKQIECKVVKEWLEKEWRFKELALDKKYYTGRSYPSRQYTHTITLSDDRTLDGELAEILYVQPYVSDPDKPLAERADVKPERVMFHKRDKGEIGTDLKSLVYVKLVKLGTEAYEEGKQKASRYRPRRKTVEQKEP